METIIQSTVTPTIKILVQGGTEVDRTWTLCLDYRALAKIEKETGLDLKKAGNWPSIRSGETFPKIIWCCLGRYSPDVTEDDVRDNLNPQAHDLLWGALFDITFPGLSEAWEKAQKEKTSPNETPEAKTA